MIQSDAKEVMMVIRDMSLSMTRIESEKDFIKESILELAEKHDLNKKDLRKVATIYHKQNLAEVQASNNEVEDLYETLVVGTRG
jgi:putative protein kinase ArgK-like GTPase of G3E family